MDLDKDPVDRAAAAYIAAIDPAHRPLFDRVHALLLDRFPEARVVLSYAMPTYVVGRSRLHVGVWRHGISFYGWADDAGLVARHPELLSGRSTVRLRAADADAIGDGELRDFLTAAIGPR